MVNFAILALVGPTQGCSMLWRMDISRNQVKVGPHWTPIGSRTER